MLGREQTRDDLGQGSVFKAKFSDRGSHLPSKHLLTLHCLPWVHAGLLEVRRALWDVTTYPSLVIS